MFELTPPPPEELPPWRVAKLAKQEAKKAAQKKEAQEKMVAEFKEKQSARAAVVSPIMQKKLLKEQLKQAKLGKAGKTVTDVAASAKKDKGESSESDD